MSKYLKQSSWYIVDQDAAKSIPRYTPPKKEYFMTDGNFCPIKYFIWAIEMTEKYSGGSECESR